MAKSEPKIEEMPSDCDFTNGANPEIGKYAGRYKQHARVIMLDEDVAKHFPDAVSVNNALRSHLSQIDSQNAG
jgi:hypothetical protein